MSKIKINVKDLPTDLLEFIRRIWNKGAVKDLWQDGDRYIMDTALQHVEFSPEGKSFRMRVWGRTVDTRLFDPAIDRVI